MTVIGQGTAAVAGQSLARWLAAELAATPVRVEALPATELSGFLLRSDMSDTLVVAISQSGTTTDTNRTVDLVRGRGGHVVAIVNRRASDLTDKSDGVLYTSDGRDVEMSVASTKAFYAQIAAGFLLAAAIAQEVPGTDAGAARRHELLTGLRELPTAMEATLERRAVIAEAAQEVCPPRRYWAIVGSGANRVAAEEIRIKLSELCYKAIASDAIEDKKHIDLSSEPLILVCAAGLSGSNADDVAKEVAIYRAHKATPIVIATEDEDRFSAALRVITVPAVHHELAFVLTTVVGHLFGYEAALAIDAQARPLREARGAIEEAVSVPDAPDAEAILSNLRAVFEPIGAKFGDGLRTGAYNGHLEAGTAVRLASMFRYATGVAPLDAYQVEHGRVGTPSQVIEDFTAALTAAIEELTRPVDAIKHQAKTVTVGISRSDEGLLDVALVAAALDGRCRPRPSQLQGAAHPGRPRRRHRGGGGLHPLPHRGRRGGLRGHHRGGGPGRHRPGPAAAHRAQPAAARHQAPGGHRARGHRGGGPQRRPEPGADPRGEGQPVHRHHAAARPVRRRAPRRADAQRARGLPRSLRGAEGRGHRDRAHLPRRPARLGHPHRAAHRARERAGRSLAHVGRGRLVIILALVFAVALVMIVVAFVNNRRGV